jgi:uncharacterized protein (TIGR02996 family)
MTERRAFLSQILDHPDDDTARLVFADWLEENGEPEFGRFLRAGVTLAKYRHAPAVTSIGEDYWEGMRVLRATAETVLAAQLAAALVRPDAGFAWCHMGWDAHADLVTARYAKGRTVKVTRGLVSELRIDLDEWLKVAYRVLSAAPLETVVITDAPGLTFYVRPPQPGGRLAWRVEAMLMTDPGARTPEGLPVRVAAGRHYPGGRGYLVLDCNRDLPEMVRELRELAGRHWPQRPGRRRFTPSPGAMAEAMRRLGDHIRGRRNRP